MKKLLFLLLLAPFAVQAQTTTGAQAQAGSQSQAGAQAGAIGIQVVEGGGNTPAGDPGGGDFFSPDASGGMGVGIGGSSSANNAGNKQAITFNSVGSDLSKAHKNTPSVVAPALASTLTDTCMGSITGGVSGAGFGVAGGKTYVDEECVRRLHSKFLASAQQGELAMQIMCGSDMVAEAAATLAEQTNGVDKCTGESYAMLEPVTPADKDLGPIPLLGPDVAEAIDVGVVLTEDNDLYFYDD